MGRGEGDGAQGRLPVWSDGLTPDAHLDLLVALEDSGRAMAVAWVGQLDVVGRLLARPATIGGRSDQAELALALRVTEREAQSLLLHASQMARRTAVRTALLSGRLNVRQGQAVLEELVGIDPAVAAAIEAELLAGDGLVRRRAGQLRDWIGARVVAADPAGARERRRATVRDRTGVRFTALRDGLAEAAICGPADQVLEFLRSVERLVPPRDPADGRTRGQWRFLTVLGAVAQAAVAAGVTRPAVELQLQLPAVVTERRVPAGCARPEPVVLRLDVAGLAAVLASAREQGAAVDPLRWAWTGSAPSRPAAAGSAANGGDAAVLGGDVGPAESRVASVPRPRQSRDLPDRDPPVPLVKRPGPPTRNRPSPVPLAPASVPILVGFGPVDPALVAELLPRVLVRRLMVDPAGTVSAVDPSPLRLDETFTAAVPQPPAPTAAYAPTARQRRVVQARDLHCTFPGCAVSSTRCDLDHLTAWAQGGPTAVSNLHALCRHHHRLKHDGWHLTQTPDGTTTWNSPRGRAYQAPSAR